MILQIDDTADEIYFPDPHYGDEDGCFAIGGDLSIDRLLLAYSNGIFPWYSFPRPAGDTLVLSDEAFRHLPG